MNKIKLIIGLGNPGKEYEFTRHNVGFLFIDALGKEMSEVQPRSCGVGLRMVKLQSFMNKSGTAVLALAKQYKIKPENVLIVHDDIDILWGAYKFSFGRSSAGHKGVESVIKSLKTKNFWRLRIGIQPSPTKIFKKNLGGQARTRANKIILKKFTEGELKELDKTIKKAASELETALL